MTSAKFLIVHIFKSRKNDHVIRLEKTISDLIDTSNEVQSRAYLIGIDRTERVNVFTFARNGEIFRIETMGLISDDIDQWTRDLL